MQFYFTTIHKCKRPYNIIWLWFVSTSLFWPETFSYSCACVLLCFGKAPEASRHRTNTTFLSFCSDRLILSRISSTHLFGRGKNVCVCSEPVVQTKCKYYLPNLCFCALPQRISCLQILCASASPYANGERSKKSLATHTKRILSFKCAHPKGCIMCGDEELFRWFGLCVCFCASVGFAGVFRNLLERGWGNFSRAWLWNRLLNHDYGTISSRICAEALKIGENKCSVAIRMDQPYDYAAVILWPSGLSRAKLRQKRHCGERNGSPPEMAKRTKKIAFDCLMGLHF